MLTNDDDSAESILDIALDAGIIVLQNGGETYRTEDTMISVARSLGASDSSAFVTPTGVMLTCTGRDGHSHTRVQRITDRTINLGKIARVNEISRRLAARRRAAGPAADPALTSSVLGRVKNSRLHHPAGVVLSTGLACFFFSILFKGTLREASVSFIIGIALRLVLFLVNPLGLSGFIVSVLGGFLISLLSRAAVFFGLAASSGNISISVLMILVPGIAIVNAIRDIIAGDLVAGSARLLEAFVTAAALSLGAAFGLLLFPAETGRASSILFIDDASQAFLFALFATASFAWFFYINRYDIFWSSLIGATGWLVYLVSSRDYWAPETGYLVGALCVGLLSEACAVILKKPATVYIVPGIIPLVPGGGMYETMFAAVSGNLEEAARNGFSTLTCAAAIAVGIALASSAARLAGKIRRRS